MLCPRHHILEAYLQKFFGEADGDDAGRAAHAAQAVGDDVGTHLELVHDLGTKAGRGAVQRAVGDQNVDLHSAPKQRLGSMPTCMHAARSATCASALCKVSGHPSNSLCGPEYSNAYSFFKPYLQLKLVIVQNADVQELQLILRDHMMALKAYSPMTLFGICNCGAT